MLVQIRRYKGKIAGALLVTAALGMISCATQQPQNVALVKDPEKHEADSMIPWDKQEKWESNGGLSGITDRR